MPPVTVAERQLMEAHQMVRRLIAAMFDYAEERNASVEAAEFMLLCHRNGKTVKA